MSLCAVTSWLDQNLAAHLPYSGAGCPLPSPSNHLQHFIEGGAQSLAFLEGSGAAAPLTHLGSHHV